MKFYLILLFSVIAALIGVNICCYYIFADTTLLYAILIAPITVAIVLPFEIICSYIITFLRLKYNYKKFPFVSYKFERNFYEKLGVKKWKDSIPDTGSFKKDKIQSTDSSFLFVFIKETCMAEFIHFCCIFFALSAFLIVPIELVWRVTIPLLLMNTFMHTLPIIVQRYNRPKLIKIAQRQQLKEQLIKDN